ncbi:hypothetical protein CCS01_15545 [Rhodopila globiformis]|jgi:hypothetical protein|uniref:Glycine zipper 2TM domain protein n=2 Tax=Rhodopila globiformis TaxID=1071 RepID=A0A2S6NDJ6_RHOGL|nr:hypothetical protein [Rhodopila globiformis]PPQ32661.1 hypothetical protein CCS01_15545 [Rhodopila globiformis]
MRTLAVAATLALAFAVGLAGPAEAKGCLSGAAVGGLAGHMAHHGVLGAVGGCAVGHHMASKHEKQAAAQAQGNGAQGNGAQGNEAQRN